MKVWGEGWNPELERTEPTIGEVCTLCDVAIVAGDAGVIMPFISEEEVSEVVCHRTCFLRHLGVLLSADP